MTAKQGLIPLIKSIAQTIASRLSPGANINGVLFDGSADITVPAAAGTLTGTTLASNVVNASLNSITPTGGKLGISGGVAATYALIGTTSLERKLTINGGANDEGIRIDNGSGWRLDLLAAESGNSITSVDSQPLNVKIGTTTRLAVTASGASVTGGLAVTGSRINLASLPTSASGLAAGDLWNDSGTLKVA